MPERGTKSSDCVEASDAACRAAKRSVSVPISLESAASSGRPKGMPKGGPVFIAALKQGSVFILGGIHSAFRVKCKRADVFSYYPPQ